MTRGAQKEPNPQSIEFETFPDQMLAVLTLHSGANADALEEFTSEYYGNLPARHLIVHVKVGVTGHFSNDQLKELLWSNYERAQVRRGGHTVFVLDDRHDLPMMRWLKAFSENGANWPVQYHFADSLEDAFALITHLNDRGGE